MVGKPSVFSKQEHARLEKKLRDPKNGLAGYVELQQWVKEELNKDVKYNTLLKYAARHLGASVKAARKSHVNKDEQASETFKKILGSTDGYGPGSTAQVFIHKPLFPG
jgi:transposase